MNMAISSGRLFQPTYPVRGTTDYQLDDTPHYFISTHAPREGCDARAISRLVGLRAFQPTHPARGATVPSMLEVNLAKFQSTHPARGATTMPPCGRASAREFQSTHPARGATCGAGVRHLAGPISIHAPREGCDRADVSDGVITQISIHAPREGCDSTHSPLSSRLALFQSTHPARGATLVHIRRANRSTISIHAPREGCDMLLQMF